MWIAVYNQEIIGAAKTVQGLVKQVQKKGLSLADISEQRGRISGFWLHVTNDPWLPQGYSRPTAAIPDGCYLPTIAPGFG
jgi:hypothetical protein